MIECKHRRFKTQRFDDYNYEAKTKETHTCVKCGYSFNTYVVRKTN